MLQNTFVHIPGVGFCTEQRLWAESIHNWSNFPSTPELQGRRLTNIGAHVVKSIAAYTRGDASFFQRLSAIGES
jgi:uncharacterized protein